MAQFDVETSLLGQRLAITRRFAKMLNKGLKNTLGDIPSAAELAAQFNLRGYGIKAISRETARKWKSGLSFPEAGHLQVLTEWLNLNPSAVFSNAKSTFNSGLPILYSATELVSSSHKLRNSEHLAQAALNALSPRTAVLDKTGLIIMVSNAWRSYAVSDPDMRHYKTCCEGVNYLDVCDQAHGRDAEYASQMAAGIRAVMRRVRTEFSLKYPCHITGAQQWFIGRVRRFADSNAVCTVITHERITESRFAEGL